MIKPIIPDKCDNCGCNVFIEYGHFTGKYEMYVSLDSDKSGELIYDKEPDMAPKIYGKCAKCGMKVRLYE